MNQEYYLNKSTKYGMGHTRLRRVLGLVGAISGKKILDVGCANGRLGAKLKDLGAVVYGIDVSSIAVAEASQKIDKAIVVDISEEWPDLGEKFSVIVISEVLEHMFDPVFVLSQAARFLEEGGKIIITVPNFLVWTNRIKFLFGNFSYEDQGMFDFGHIRWFTYDYLGRVLDDVGLKVTEERHIIYPGKLAFFLRFWPSLFSWQFIISVSRK